MASRGAARNALRFPGSTFRGARRRARWKRTTPHQLQSPLPAVTRIHMEPIAPRAEVTVYSPLFSPFRQQLQGIAVSIGRASDCSIPVKDRYLARKHAEIVADHGSWGLNDPRSVNGDNLHGKNRERGQAR